MVNPGFAIQKVGNYDNSKCPGILGSSWDANRFRKLPCSMLAMRQLAMRQLDISEETRQEPLLQINSTGRAWVDRSKTTAGLVQFAFNGTLIRCRGEG